jgi:hypothetical protein
MNEQHRNKIRKLPAMDLQAPLNKVGLWNPTNGPSCVKEEVA